MLIRHTMIRSTEDDIVCEHGNCFVVKIPRGYEVDRNGAAHATVDSLYPLTDAGRSLAIARCRYIGRAPLSETIDRPSC